MSRGDEDAFQSIDFEPLDDIDSDFFADEFDDLSNDLISQNYCRTNNNDHNSEDPLYNPNNYRNPQSDDRDNMNNNNPNQSTSNSADDGARNAYARSSTSANNDNNSSENDNTNTTNNTNNNNTNNNNNNNSNNVTSNNRNINQVPLLEVRDRLFYALFFRGCLIYARLVPPPARRIIEFIILLKAVVAFFILIYVHTKFILEPTTCLSHIQDSWPRDGILRVEILRNGTSGYTIENSYAREKKIREQRAYEMNMFLTSFKLPFEWFGDVHIESSLDDDAVSEDSQKKKPEENDYEESELSTEKRSNASADSWTENNGSLFSSTSWTNVQMFEEFDGNTNKVLEKEDVNSENSSFNETMMKRMMTSLSEPEPDHPLKEEPSDIEKLVRAVWPDEEYIVEFSLEYGFLRLSPQVRQKLNIPVKIVTLNPNEDICFGDQIMRFILERIIGYDDLLMISIKTLAEKENDKGFLRNVVTGEHYRFVTLWMSRGSYIIAGGIMLAFTLSISMLLRYSHHQIFVFIVNLLQMAEFNTEVTFPAAPLFTVILALIGMEAVMSEFFNDSSTAFYIILIVWIGDQYESICCQRAVTKRHWIKFFYLYHFSFYAYHYRFNGQYSGLALVTSWLFIEHSMIYFLHHYELPIMLRRYQLQQFMLSQRVGTTPAAGEAATESFRFVTVDAESRRQLNRSRPSILSMLERYRTAAILMGIIRPDRGAARTPVDGSGDRPATGGDNTNASPVNSNSNVSSIGDSHSRSDTQSEISETSPPEPVPSKDIPSVSSSSSCSASSSRVTTTGYAADGGGENSSVVQE